MCIYNKELLLSSANCIDVAEYIGMPIIKKGRTIYTQCVSGCHTESQFDHCVLYNNGCFCFSCGHRYDTAGMVMAYYENVLGQSINFQEALGIIGDSLGGRDLFTESNVSYTPFPLSEEELLAIGLQSKNGHGKIITSYMEDADGDRYTEQYTNFGNIKLLFASDRDVCLSLLKNKCKDALVYWRNYISAVQYVYKEDNGMLTGAMNEYVLAKNAYIKLGGKITQATKLFSL